MYLNLEHLTYEAADQIVKAGLGITTAIGIGGDPIIGTTTKDAVELLMNDSATEGIIMIGEIGGTMEADAAKWIKENGTQTCCRIYCCWTNSSQGRTMDMLEQLLAVMILPKLKMKIMSECGIHVVASPQNLDLKMQEVLS